MRLYLASTSPARLATLRAAGIEPILLAYGKPHDPAVARERWMLQRGRTGQLHSGHWLIDARRAPAAELDEGPATNSVPELDEGPATGTLPGIGDVSTATVQFMDDMTDDEIDAYIATGEPLEVAGAFTIDSLGAAFIREVHGDPHAVVGLSVSLLRILVRRFGIDWPQLWNLPL
jgi:septum formation protein